MRRWLPIAGGGLLLLAGVVWIVMAVPRPAAPVDRSGPLPVPDVGSGPLAGLVVYLSPGHGWLLHRVRHDGAPFAWGRQRARQHDMVEDDWTADFVAHDLAPALEEAGAVPISLRERDRNPVAVVADDGAESCSVFEAEQLVTDPLSIEGSYSRLASTGGAVWWLEVPDDGHWYVYARWGEHVSQDPQAVFTVRAGGDVRETVVDQRVHGGHWWPLGDFCLPGGSLVEVFLGGSGAGALSADAIRLGGGTFTIVPEFDHEVRQHPFWEVAMPHQLERLGGPPDVGNYACGNPVSDMRLRPHWASWAAPRDEEAVYVSIHTNASPWGVARGLTVFAGFDSNPRTPADPESIRLSEAVESGVWDAVSARDPDYERRGVRLGDFSEISPHHNELPATLLELGFHDDAVDAARLRSQRFREDAAAGIVDGLATWRAGH